MTLGLRKRLRLPRARGDTPLVAELSAAIGHEHVQADDMATRLYRRDASVFDGGAAGPVCFPGNSCEVADVVRIARRHGRAIVARGAGTGLAGGAIPMDGAVVVSTMRMNKILDIDLEDRVAWVEPGVVNLDLSKLLRPLGFHFAPDPSSQQVCTIGGNVANNSGGPHCLAYGVTNAHVMAIEVVLPDGEVAMLGGVEGQPLGLDLRGVFVGGEGTLGIATRIAVVLTPNPPITRTMLISFETISDAANTVSAVIAAGIVPAALEVMDRRITAAVENYVHAGYPLDAGAVLLAEVDGMLDGVEVQAARIGEIARCHRALDVRVAASAAERELLWKGRKTAFGAIAQIAPDYYLHDTVVPRSSLAEVLEQVENIAARHELIVMNVFHAGDGNLHPLLLFDARRPGELDRVHAAGAEIVRVSLAAGGVLTGEHGIGVEKQDFMRWQFTDDDLDHQDRLRLAFDPARCCNPGKVLPTAHSCADIQTLHAPPPSDVWV